MLYSWTIHIDPLVVLLYLGIGFNAYLHLEESINVTNQSRILAGLLCLVVFLVWPLVAAVELLVLIWKLVIRALAAFIDGE